MKVIETERLVLRWLSTEDDAAFILELINDPSWIEFLGDKGIRTLDGARDYVANGPVAMYGRAGFGLYRVELKAGGEPIGICGLIRREGMVDVDIGYAFLPRFCGRGYALEAAAGTLAYGRDVLGLRRIVAYTNAGNHASIRLLEKLGLHGEGTIQIVPEGPLDRLFAIDF